MTKDEIEQIAKLIEGSEKRLTSKIETVEKRLTEKVETVEKRLTSKIESVDQKVELLRDDNKKAHTQIMDVLIESGEINYQEVKKELTELKKRVEQLESPHKN